MDIETIKFMGKQLPVSISTVYTNNYKTKVWKTFLNEYELLNTGHQSAINKLWSEYLCT